MPAVGTPVASTITSISGTRDQRFGIVGDMGRAPLERIAERRGAQTPPPASRRCASWLCARATSRSATATTCMPRVSRACDRNMVPNLPAPIRPTVTGRPAAFAFEQHGVEVHGTPRALARQRTAITEPDRGSCHWHTARVTKISVAHSRVVRRRALEQQPRRAFLLGLGVEALAGLESLAAAHAWRPRVAIGRAVRRRRATLAPASPRARSAIPTSPPVASLAASRASLAELVEVLLRALHVRFELGRALLQPAAEGVDEAGLEAGSRRDRRRRRRLARRRRLRLCRLHRLSWLHRLHVLASAATASNSAPRPALAGASTLDMVAELRRPVCPGSLVMADPILAEAPPNPSQGQAANCVPRVAKLRSGGTIRAAQLKDLERSLNAT